MTAAAGPPRLSADQAVQALCWPPSTSCPDRCSDCAAHDGSAARAAVVARAATDDLGALLETTVRSKTIGLLADHAQRNSVPGLDRATTRFLAATLRLNRHKIGLYRDAALAATSALHAAGISSAVLGGMSVEHTLYGGRGARQCSDIDLLVAPQDRAAAERVLHRDGYRSAGASPWTRLCDDAVVPLLVIDLTCSLPHAEDPDGDGDGGVTAVLSRRIAISVPRYHGHAQTAELLPVLAGGDALAHTLARLGSPPRAAEPRAAGSPARPRWALLSDAIRQAHREAPAGPQHEAVRAGWSALRVVWPELPQAPAEVGDDQEPRR